MQFIDTFSFIFLLDIKNTNLLIFLIILLFWLFFLIWLFIIIFYFHTILFFFFFFSVSFLFFILLIFRLLFPFTFHIILFSLTHIRIIITFKFFHIFFWWPLHGFLQYLFFRHKLFILLFLIFIDKFLLEKLWFLGRLNNLLIMNDASYFSNLTLNIIICFGWSPLDIFFFTHLLCISCATLGKLGKQLSFKNGIST